MEEAEHDGSVGVGELLLDLAERLRHCQQRDDARSRRVGAGGEAVVQRERVQLCEQRKHTGFLHKMR